MYVHFSCLSVPMKIQHLIYSTEMLHISICNGYVPIYFYSQLWANKKPFCLCTHFEQNALKLLCQHVHLSSTFSGKYVSTRSHLSKHNATLKHSFAWSAVLRQIIANSGLNSLQRGQRLSFYEPWICNFRRNFIISTLRSQILETNCRHHSNVLIF